MNRARRLSHVNVPRVLPVTKRHAQLLLDRYVSWYVSHGRIAALVDQRLLQRVRRRPLERVRHHRFA